MKKPVALISAAALVFGLAAGASAADMPKSAAAAPVAADPAPASTTDAPKTTHKKKHHKKPKSDQTPATTK